MQRPRCSVVVLLVVVYFEPLIIRWVGQRCDASVGGSSDLLRILLFPLLALVESSLGLRAVALLVWNGAFWLYLGRALWFRPGGLRYVHEWAFMELLSVMLHVLVCSHADHDPVGTGYLALDALLSPTAASTNTLFLPRVAWLIVDVQSNQLSVLRWAGGVLTVVALGLILGQFTSHSWCFTYAVAWAVMCPSRLIVPAPVPESVAASPDEEVEVFHAGGAVDGREVVTHTVGDNSDDTAVLNDDSDE